MSIAVRSCLGRTSESYRWPDPAAAASTSLEWYEENLPEDMCLISDSYAYHFEFLCT